MKKVLLICKKCDRKMKVDPIDTDPEGTASIHLMCPQCNPGDFDEPVYFNKIGKEIIYKCYGND